MEKAKETETGREIEHISLQMNNNGYPPQRDLLQRFREGNQNPRKFEFEFSTTKEEEEEEEEEEIELNLGLSLGGCFGTTVDPKENNNKLFRSSSIGGLATLYRDDDFTAPQPVLTFPSTSGLNRTCSLPTEAEEEEWRKRKELQSLRRMEAKRKRSEKQRNGRIATTTTTTTTTKQRNCEIEKPVEEEEEESRRVMNVKVKIEGGTGLPSYSVGAAVKQETNNVFSAASVTTPPYGLPFWAALSRGGATGVRNSDNGKPGSFRGGLPPPSPPGSQGSSGISEFETKPVQGLNNCTEARSPSSVHSLPEQREQKNSTNTENSYLLNKVEVKNPLKKPKVVISNTGSVREMETKVMDEMPCVSTRAVGPNGRRIEGFLYKYRKGEEVRIVCVCHGSCLSPAEFVKHAGGGDVAHPLRHIVVSPSPSFL